MSFSHVRLLVEPLLALPLAGCGGSGGSAGSVSRPVKIDSAPASDLHGTEIAKPYREPDVTLTGTSGKPVNPASPDVAAAYFTIVNSGGTADTLTGVRTDVSGVWGSSVSG